MGVGVLAPTLIWGLCLSPVGARESTSLKPPPGLAQQDGVLYKEGRPYRGVGVNYFDLFLRLLHDVTADNERSYMLRLTAEANRRWNAAARRPADPRGRPAEASGCSTGKSGAQPREPGVRQSA